jgi:hypothetical protein
VCNSSAHRRKPSSPSGPVADRELAGTGRPFATDSDDATSRRLSTDRRACVAAVSATIIAAGFVSAARVRAGTCITISTAISTGCIRTSSDISVGNGIIASNDVSTCNGISTATRTAGIRADNDISPAAGPAADVCTAAGTGAVSVRVIASVISTTLDAITGVGIATSIGTSAGTNLGFAQRGDRGGRGGPCTLPVSLRSARRQRRRSDMARGKRAIARQRVQPTAGAGVRL